MKNFTETQLKTLLGSIHTEVSYLRERISLLESLLNQFTEKPLSTFVYEPRNQEDVLFKHIVEALPETEMISASYIQRKFAVGYARAARILDTLQEQGYVGPAFGSKPRKILKRA